jgi:glutamine synthetase
MKNLQFLTFFINTIKAVNEYEELIRAAIASASNDHRLGANEAPPAIISVFIGSQLTEVLDELEKVTDGKLSPQEKTELKLNVVGKIPEILLDNTDRNRTSPFAFTGNKFELRAVGSTANCANPMTVLNAVVAKQLIEFKAEVDALIADKKMKKDDAIFNVLREYIKDSKRIRFEGDGYGQAWEDEAAKRGLSNHKTTPQALKAKVSKQAIELYEQLGIMSKVEIEARHEIEVEEYAKRIQIEGRILGDIARNHVIPTAIRYQNILIENVQGLKDIYGEGFKKIAAEQMSLIEQISGHIEHINKGITQMIEARKKANTLDDMEACAFAYCNEVKPLFDDIRYQNILIENVQGLKDIYGEGFKKIAAEQMSLIEQISGHIEHINKGITQMIEARKKANAMEDMEACAFAYCNEVKPLFDDIRYHCDKLELLVDDELWPLVKYRELLFTR